MKYIMSLILILSFFGCTNKPSPSTERIDNKTKILKSSNCIVDKEYAPNWICEQSKISDGYITGIGLSSATDKDKEAEILGIERLFSKIKKDITTRTKEYFLLIGLSPDDYGTLPKQLSYYVSKKAMGKTDLLAEWVRKKTNTKYVLVGIKKDKIGKISSDFLINDVKNKKTIKSFAIAFDYYFKK